MKQHDQHMAGAQPDLSDIPDLDWREQEVFFAKEMRPLKILFIGVGIVLLPAITSIWFWLYCIVAVSYISYFSYHIQKHMMILRNGKKMYAKLLSYKFGPQSQRLCFPRSADDASLPWLRQPQGMALGRENDYVSFPVGYSDTSSVCIQEI